MNVSAITSASSPAAAVAAGLTPAERVRAGHLHGNALRHAPAAQQRAAVASQFEAVLVRQLLGHTLDSMLGGASGSSVYGDLLTNAFAEQLTAGGGIGLAPVIEQQLTPRGAAPAGQHRLSP